jgi:teichuronic acid biosynthesis glycosyltransferase TuaG
MIIVDDCSKDNTYEVASEIAKTDNRIKVIRLKTNLGVAAVRNTALDIAKGDYVAFLDSDDQWVPEKLENQLAFMEANHYALTYTDYQMFTSDNESPGKVIHVPSQMTYTDIFKNTSIACLTVMVNRQLVGVFHMPLLNHTEDQCTWQEILKRGYVAYGLNENLAMYRVSNKSLTGNKSKAIKRQWHTYRKYYKLSLLKSSYYFICYVINALKKHA